MPISTDLLNILVCPETKQKVKPVDDQLVAKLNHQIAAGTLKNRAGEILSQQLSGALIREDGKYLYPIQQEIPIMLIEEAVPMAEIDN